MLFENLCAVHDPEPHDAALNMAIDEVLLRTQRGPTLRIYHWAQRAISFGYFEKRAALPRVPAGWETVRRWTGGGVVEHGLDVTYTLVVPAEHALARLPARDCYRLIHECIANLLAEQGMAAELTPSAAAKVSAACFENAAEADILSAGRKVAGAAQRRTRWGLLHQGSVQGLHEPARLAAALPAAFSAEVVARDLSADDLAAAHECAGAKYATDAWRDRF